MEGFFDSVTVRILAGVVVAVLGIALYFSFDIYQFFARRDFTNLNAYLVHFTRHDNGSKDDAVRLELIGYKIPLRDICRNRFLFWVILIQSWKATAENPVLNFGKWRYILPPVRGRVSECWRSMVMKRTAGFPYKEMPCQLALVYDPSESNSNFVIRIILIQDRDLKDFAQYEAKRPINSNNLDFVRRIVRAHTEKTGSFINVRITAA